MTDDQVIVTKEMSRNAADLLNMQGTIEYLLYVLGVDKCVMGPEIGYSIKNVKKGKEHGIALYCSIDTIFVGHEKTLLAILKAIESPISYENFGWHFLQKSEWENSECKDLGTNNPSRR